MSDFKVGDTVWFKPEDRSYAMNHYKSMGPFTIYKISGSVAWLKDKRREYDLAGSYLHRLQHNVFLEAAMKAIADAGT